jgi:hypothetical protein
MLLRRGESSVPKQAVPRSSRVLLDNPTGRTVGYNLCFSTLERQTDEGWRRVEEPEAVCTAIQHGLEPGDSTSFTKTLMGDLPAGTYRFATEVEYGTPAGESR